MANVFRPYIKVTGGTSDALDGETQMIEGDTALVSTLDGIFYIYVCRNSAAAASTPSVVQPVNVTSDLRWHLAHVTTQGSEHWAASVGGTANAITLAFAPAFTSMPIGTSIFFKATLTNTGACTLNVDGLGAMSLKYNGAELSPGDILAGCVYVGIWDGTVVQLINLSALYARKSDLQLSTRTHRHNGGAGELDGILDYAVAGGTANALTVALNPPLTQHIPGMPIYIKITATNTGPVTLNVDSLDVRSIKKAGAALDAGDILAGQIIEVAYDGASFQLLSAYNLLDYATSTGSANAYVLTLAPALPALVAGRMLTFKANFANTGAATLNVNGLGAKSLKRVAADLTANSILSGQIVTVIYDGTNFQLVACISPAASEMVPGILKLASTALAQGLTDDAAAVTPLKLANALKGSNQLLGTNGYQRLPGGLIIQWGTVTGLNSSGGATITYPISFPTAAVAAFALMQGGPSGVIQTGPIGTISMSLNLSSNWTGSSTTAFWLAIGY